MLETKNSLDAGIEIAENKESLMEKGYLLFYKHAFEVFRRSAGIPVCIRQLRITVVQRTLKKTFPSVLQLSLTVKYQS